MEWAYRVPQYYGWPKTAQDGLPALRFPKMLSEALRLNYGLGQAVRSCVKSEAKALEIALKLNNACNNYLK